MLRVSHRLFHKDGVLSPAKRGGGKGSGGQVTRSRVEVGGPQHHANSMGARAAAEPDASAAGP
eukprot:4375275-Alexandrium_andersonii.AAC.1